MAVFFWRKVQEFGLVRAFTLEVKVFVRVATAAMRDLTIRNTSEFHESF